MDPQEPTTQPEPTDSAQTNEPVATPVPEPVATSEAPVEAVTTETSEIITPSATITPAPEVETTSDATAPETPPETPVVMPLPVAAVPGMPESTVPPSVASVAPTKTSPLGKLKSLKPKMLVMIIAGVVVLGVVLYLIVTMFGGSGPKKFSAKDLKTDTKGRVTFSYPKQWKDATKVEEVSKFIKSGNFGSDYSVYADDIIKNAEGKEDIANAFTLLSKLSGTFPVSDEQLKEALKDPKVKQELENSLSDEFTAEKLKSGQDCEAVNNLAKDILYESNGFALVVQISLDCKLGTEEAKKQSTPSTHFEIKVLETKGELYIYVLVAKQKSWDINKTVFEKMADDITAK